MCLFVNGKRTAQFKAEQPKDKWFVVWKVLSVFRGDVTTPYRHTKVSLNSQKMTARGRLSAALRLLRLDGNGQSVGSGAIHAYTRRTIADRMCWKVPGDVVCKAYVKASDVLYIGQNYDVAVKRLVLDQDSLNNLRTRCGMVPIQWR